MAVTAFNFDSTAEEVAASLSKEITGKNVIINGATWNSMGSEAARVIAKYANLVVLGGRSLSNIQTTIDNIKKETPKANLRAFTLDLSTLEGVRQGAKEINAMSENFDVLINSAGIMAAPLSKTADGLEHHMAVNHHAPFLFTSLIFPKLVAAGKASSSPARVVGITSIAHHYGGLQEDVNFDDEDKYDKWVAYGQSKTATVLFMDEVARRSKESNVPVVAYSVHPGAIATTNLTVYMAAEDWDQFKNEDGSFKYAMKSAGQGTASYIVAAFDPALLPHSGSYIDDADVNNAGRAEFAKSHADAERLWGISEKAVGQKFVI